MVSFASYYLALFLVAGCHSWSSNAFSIPENWATTSISLFLFLKRYPTCQTKIGNMETGISHVVSSRDWAKEIKWIYFVWKAAGHQKITKKESRILMCQWRSRLLIRFSKVILLLRQTVVFSRLIKCLNDANLESGFLKKKTKIERILRERPPISLRFVVSLSESFGDAAEPDLLLSHSITNRRAWMSWSYRPFINNFLIEASHAGLVMP